MGHAVAVLSTDDAVRAQAEADAVLLVATAKAAYAAGRHAAPSWPWRPVPGAH